jgi:hypothetical protein
MQGEPFWYLHDGQKNEIQGVVIPRGFQARYSKSGIGKFFGTLKEFAEKSQWREFTSNKYISEEMRRANLAGYVLTELADIEWECNGLLQYDRSPKIFAQHYALFNGDDLLLIRPDKRTYRDGEQVTLKFYLSSFSGTRIETGVLRWQIPAIGLDGEQPVVIQKYRSIKLLEVTVPIPQISEALLNTPINAQVISSVGDIFAQNFEPISVIPNDALDPELTGIPLQVYDPGQYIASELGKWNALGFSTQNVEPKTPWDVQNPCIATKYDRYVRAFLRAGGRVLYSLEFLLPPKERRLAVRKLGLFHFDAIQTLVPHYLLSKKIPGLPIWVKPFFRGESWDGMFSLLFAEPRLFNPLPFQNPLNWESEEIWPDFRLNCSGKNFLRSGTLAGLVFGWVNAIFPLVFKTNVGSGTLILSTFNLLRHVADNPLAIILFSNLLWELRKEF